MLKYPEIDPIIFSVGPFDLLGFTIGPLAVRWYGLMARSSSVPATGFARDAEPGR
jgi:prolipoprotein diacylglyceryltransferase